MLKIALGMPGWPETLFVLILVLLLFGAKKLPELARGLAQSLNEFRKARDEFESEIQKTAEKLESKPAPQTQQHKPS